MWTQYLSFLFILNVVSAAIPSPEYWPPIAQTKQAISLDGNLQLKKGVRFTLLRIEGERVLGTFGRQGTHWIDIDATDVVELSTAIESGQLAKFAPNLVERLYTTLYQRVESGEAKPVRLQDLKHAKYLLFYFAHGHDVRHAKNVEQFSDAYSELRAKLPELEVIMVQCDGLVFKQAEPHQITWPFMAVHLSYAYAEALHLGQDNEGSSFVLTGSNGDLLARYNPSRISISDMVADILSVAAGQ